MSRQPVVAALRRERRALGNRLCELRERHELTQEQAAERIGLSDRQLRKIELGTANPTMATLVACAVAYRVPFHWLFTPPPR